MVLDLYPVKSSSWKIKLYWYLLRFSIIIRAAAQVLKACKVLPFPYINDNLLPIFRYWFYSDSCEEESMFSRTNLASWLTGQLANWLDWVDVWPVSGPPQWRTLRRQNVAGSEPEGSWGVTHLGLFTDDVVTQGVRACWSKIILHNQGWKVWGEKSGYA